MTRAVAVALARYRRRHPKLVSIRYTAIVGKTNLPVADRRAFVRWAEGMLEARRQTATLAMARQLGYRGT